MRETATAYVKEAIDAEFGLGVGRRVFAQPGIDERVRADGGVRVGLLPVLRDAAANVANRPARKVIVREQCSGIRSERLRKQAEKHLIAAFEGSDSSWRDNSTGKLETRMEQILNRFKSAKAATRLQRAVDKEFGPHVSVAVFASPVLHNLLLNTETDQEGDHFVVPANLRASVHRVAARLSRSIGASTIPPDDSDDHA